MSIPSGHLCNVSNLSESAISRANDLPDHVNESEIHFSAMLSLPSVTSPWCIDVRVKGVYRSMTATWVVATVAESKLVDAVSEAVKTGSVRWRSSPRVYAIVGQRDNTGKEQTTDNRDSGSWDKMLSWGWATLK